MLRDQLIGTLELVSLETHRSDGVVTHPMGPNAMGMFIFDAGGNFSVQLMNPDRPAFAGGDATAATVEELRAAFRGYGALWGRYEVDEERQTFTLYPRGSLQPNLVGTSTVRHARFGDGVAVFNTTPQVVDGVETRTIITWKPVPGSQPH